MGSIITFYSYKGGVGRTMALANIGAALSIWGKKTLLIDWDLEAPGLENYFKTLLPEFNTVLKKEGLIDILYKKTTDPSFSAKSIIWKNYLTQIKTENNSNLFLLTSGRKDENYVTKVQNLNFFDLYNKYEGGDFLEEIRSHWKKEFDIILIDSRTGLTDSSGVCSIHMPDVLMILFTATEQGLKGTLDVVSKSKQKHQELIYDRLKLKAFPIATRFDNSELKLTEEWLNKFAKELNDIYKDFINNYEEGNNEIMPLDILVKTKVPYISFYSYGEKLPLLEQGGSDPNSIGYVYETIAAIIANDFKNIEKLKDERDSYVKMGKGEEILDFQYYKKIIQQEKEEKRLLEESLRLENKKLEEKLLLINTNKANQIAKLKTILYWVIGSILFIIIIYFIVISRGSGETKVEATADSTSSVMDTAAMTTDMVDSMAKMAIDSSAGKMMVNDTAVNAIKK